VSQCVLTWHEREQLSGVSFIRALITFTTLHPHDLITSPNCHIGVLFSTYEWGGHTSIQSIAQGDPLFP
jgi:hypothetical protein